MPLSREAAMLTPLLERLERLGYPYDRLDLCLIVDAYDTETRAILMHVAMHGPGRLLRELVAWRSGRSGW